MKLASSSSARWALEKLASFMNACNVTPFKGRDSQLIKPTLVERWTSQLDVCLQYQT